MEIIGNQSENKNELNRPRVVDVVTLVSYLDTASNRNLTIFPPIRGALPIANALASLEPKIRAAYGIRVLKYGFPDLRQYHQDIRRQLEGLLGDDIRDAVFAGFSEGAGLLAKFARFHSIPRDKVYLLAPITSYKPSSEMFASWKRQRAYMRQYPQSQELGLKKYLQELLNEGDEFYSPNGDLSKIMMLKILNQTRKDYTCTKEDLKQGVVVSGKRDFISPQTSGTDFTIDASHRFEDYIPFLSENL